MYSPSTLAKNINKLMKQSIITLAENFINIAKEREIKIVSAESCTGGLISSYISSIKGASSVFDGGFVTYSESSKIKILDVPLSTIGKYGSISAETTMSMASGAINKTDSTFSIAITGDTDLPTIGQKPYELYVCCIYIKTHPQAVTCRCYNLSSEKERKVLMQEATKIAFEYAIECILNN